MVGGAFFASEKGHCRILGAGRRKRHIIWGKKLGKKPRDNLLGGKKEH